MSQKKKKRKTKKAKNLIGLRWNAYRAHTRHLVDNIQDGYIKDLSEKDKKWLNQFNREYYGTTFSSSRSLHKGGKKTRRALYRDKNRREASVWYKHSKVDYSELMKEFFRISADSNPEDYLIRCLELKKYIEGDSSVKLDSSSIEALKDLLNPSEN